MALKLAKKTTKIKKIVKKTQPIGRAASHTTQSKDVSNLTYPTGEYFEAVGRRKTASARVRLYKSSGDFIVNDKIVANYFNTVKNAHMRFNRPFELTNTKGTFSVTAKISGSGVMSQLDALTHAMSRALLQFDPSFRTDLKAAGLLTRDDRMKETRKIGNGGKARTKRQSPKR